MPCALCAMPCAQDIAAGLLHCHSRGVVAGDLRPKKILVENGYLKIGGLCCGIDVGSVISGNAQPESDEIDSETLLYRAPEIVKGGTRNRTYSSDLWSLGCIMYEMFAGTPPFISDDHRELDQLITYGAIPPAPFANVPKTLENLVRDLLQKDPLARPKWEVLSQHPYWDGDLPSESTKHVEDHLWQVTVHQGDHGCHAGARLLIRGAYHSE